MLGSLVQWPTILTFIMFPILEVQETGKKGGARGIGTFGKGYSCYMAKVSRFIPHFG